MEDRLRSNGLAQWVLTLLPVVPVLGLLAQYPALWVVLVAYVLGTYPIWSSVVGKASRRVTESATVSAYRPSEAPGAG